MSFDNIYYETLSNKLSEEGEEVLIKACGAEMNFSIGLNGTVKFDLEEIDKMTDAFFANSLYREITNNLKGFQKDVKKAKKVLKEIIDCDLEG